MLACLTWRVQFQQASMIGKYNDISLNEKDAGLISFIGSLLFFLQQDFDKYFNNTDHFTAFSSLVCNH